MRLISFDRVNFMPGVGPAEIDQVEIMRLRG